MEGGKKLEGQWMGGRWIGRTDDQKNKITKTEDKQGGWWKSHEDGKVWQGEIW